MLFSLEDDRIESRFATYFAARLLTQEWLKSSDEIYEIYRAGSDARDAEGNELITAYAGRLPNGEWSLLLISKDPKHVYEANLIFRKRGIPHDFKGSVDVFQYSGKQYVLGGSQMQPKPLKADDPAHFIIQASSQRPATVNLPPYSLTVVRGEIGN